MKIRKVKGNVELTAAVVADALDISTRTVYRLLADGILPDLTLKSIVTHLCHVRLAPKR